MNNIINEKKELIFEACKKYHVDSLYTFGSINTDRFNSNSDIDFLVSFKMDEFKIEDYADIYFDFEYELEDILGREIDLVTERSVKNPYFKEEVIRTRLILFPEQVN